MARSAPTPQRPAARSARAATNEDHGVLLSVTICALLIALLVAGGFALSRQQTEQAELHEQARVYEHYQKATVQSPAPEMPAAFVEAQRVRDKLLSHPNVTPGPGFAQSGVQATGLAIVQAMEQAQHKPSASVN